MRRRDRKPLSKASFCQDIGRTKPTLKHYLIAWGFLWPLVPANRLVVLCEAGYPHEVLCVSRSVCDTLVYSRHELVFKPWLEAFRPGEPPMDEEDLEHLGRLRRGDAEAYDMREAHLCSSDRRRLQVHAHVRYGRESDTFYVQLEPLGDLYVPPSMDGDDSRVVRLQSRQMLLDWLSRNR